MTKVELSINWNIEEAYRFIYYDKRWGLLLICYKDRAFCVSKNCKNECGRQLTREDVREAQEYDLPISIGLFCGDERNEFLFEDE